MKELGVPRSVAVPAGGRPCGHAAPTFGCRACYEGDQDAARREAFTVWLATYKPPRCGDCGAPMVVDPEWYVKSGKLVATVFCSSPADAYPCDEDLEVVIP